MWHEHDGAPLPAHARPEDRVEIEYRCGKTDTNLVSYFWGETDILNEWIKLEDGYDIVRYRLV